MNHTAIDAKCPIDAIGCRLKNMLAVQALANLFGNLFEQHGSLDFSFQSCLPLLALQFLAHPLSYQL